MDGAQVVGREYSESIRDQLLPEDDPKAGLRWGFSESVLIDGEKLLCTPGGPEATLAALDKKTGRTLWTSKIDARASYASMIKATIGGVVQYVQFTADGVVGVDARDGAFLWRYDAPAYPNQSRLSFQIESPCGQLDQTTIGNSSPRDLHARDASN